MNKSILLALVLLFSGIINGQDKCENVRIYFTNYTDTDEIDYYSLGGLMQLSLAGYEVCPDMIYHIDNFYITVKGETIKHENRPSDDLNFYARNKLQSLEVGDSFSIKVNIRMEDEEEDVITKFTIKRTFRVVGF